MNSLRVQAEAHKRAVRRNNQFRKQAIVLSHPQAAGGGKQAPVNLEPENRGFVLVLYFLLLLGAGLIGGMFYFILMV